MNNEKAMEQLQIEKYACESIQWNETSDKIKKLVYVRKEAPKDYKKIEVDLIRKEADANSENGYFEVQTLATDLEDGTWSRFNPTVLTTDLGGKPRKMVIEKVLATPEGIQKILGEIECMIAQGIAHMSI